MPGTSTPLAERIFDLLPLLGTSLSMMFVGVLLFSSWREKPHYAIASPIIGVVFGVVVTSVLGPQWGLPASALGTVIGVNTVLFLEGKTALDVMQEIDRIKNRKKD